MGFGRLRKVGSLKPKRLIQPSGRPWPRSLRGAGHRRQLGLEEAYGLQGQEVLQPTPTLTWVLPPSGSRKAPSLKTTVSAIRRP